MIITTSRIAGDRIYRAEQYNRKKGSRDIAHSKISHAHAIQSLVHRIFCQAKENNRYIMTLNSNGSRTCSQCNVCLKN